jgi:phosphate transport system substrate-binding protein
MKSTHYVSAMVLGFAGVIGATGAEARDTIQIAGSSTVLPFASIVAEEFGNAFPEFNTPVVGSGGSGGGLRQFCEGVGENTIDIANSSRAIREAEIEVCNANGVEDIREVMFGYDGIVFATRVDRGAFELEPEHVYRAIGAEGDNAANWNEIDGDFPDQRILVAIPASNHGTREVFEETVMLPGCRAVHGDDADDEMCLQINQATLIEIVGDYTETLARLNSDNDAMGVFGLSFYDQNRDTLQVATMSGVEPSLETIASGDYPVSRPLYFYVKGEHIGVIPGLEDYVEFFMSEPINGMGGVLEDAGLIPAPREEIEANLEEFRSGAALN